MAIFAANPISREIGAPFKKPAGRSQREWSGVGQSGIWQVDNGQTRLLFQQLLKCLGASPTGRWPARCMRLHQDMRLHQKL